MNYQDILNLKQGLQASELSKEFLQRPTAINFTKLFDLYYVNHQLELIVKDADLAAEVSQRDVEWIEQMLAKRWNWLRHTNLIYLYAASPMNQVCIKLAKQIADEKNTNYFRILMPTLEVTESPVNFRSLDDDDIYLHNFIVDDSGKRFIEIEACLDYFREHGEMRHTSPQDIEVIELLSRVEKELVKTSSQYAHRYYSLAKKEYAFKNHKPTLGRALRVLSRELGLGGVHRFGQEYNAGNNANVGIVKFYDFLESIKVEDRDNYDYLMNIPEFAHVWGLLTRPKDANYENERYCVELLSGAIDTILQASPELNNKVVRFEDSNIFSGDSSQNLDELTQQVDDARKQLVDYLNDATLEQPLETSCLSKSNMGLIKEVFSELPESVVVEFINGLKGNRGALPWLYSIAGADVVEMIDRYFGASYFCQNPLSLSDLSVILTLMGEVDPDQKLRLFAAIGKENLLNKEFLIYCEVNFQSVLKNFPAEICKEILQRIDPSQIDYPWVNVHIDKIRDLTDDETFRKYAYQVIDNMDLQNMNPSQLAMFCYKNRIPDSYQSFLTKLFNNSSAKLKIKFMVKSGLPMETRIECSSDMRTGIGPEDLEWVVKHGTKEEISLVISRHLYVELQFSNLKLLQQLVLKLDDEHIVQFARRLALRDDMSQNLEESRQQASEVNMSDIVQKIKLFPAKKALKLINFMGRLNLEHPAYTRNGILSRCYSINEYHQFIQKISLLDCLELITHLREPTLLMPIYEKYCRALNVDYPNRYQVPVLMAVRLNNKLGVNQRCYILRNLSRDNNLSMQDILSHLNTDALSLEVRDNQNYQAMMDLLLAARGTPTFARVVRELGRDFCTRFMTMPTAMFNQYDIQRNAFLQSLPEHDLSALIGHVNMTPQLMNRLLNELGRRSHGALTQGMLENVEQQIVQAKWSISPLQHLTITTDTVQLVLPKRVGRIYQRLQQLKFDQHLSQRDCLREVSHLYKQALAKNNLLSSRKNQSLLQQVSDSLDYLLTHVSTSPSVNAGFETS